MITPLQRAPAPEQIASPVHEAGKRANNERYAIYQEKYRLARNIAFVCLGITAISVTGNVWQGIQSKAFPYIVERDKLGDAVALHPADHAAPIDWRAIQAEAARWVFDVRTLSTDSQSEAHFITEAYNHTDTNAPARQELNDWYSHNDPWQRAQKELVNVEILSALPLDPQIWKSWRVQWREDVRTRAGVIETSQAYEAIMSVSVIPPRTEADIQKNYDGFFVTNFTWEKRGS